jgi:hypothetical protein
MSLDFIPSVDGKAVEKSSAAGCFEILLAAST